MCEADEVVSQVQAIGELIQLMPELAWKYLGPNNTNEFWGNAETAIVEEITAKEDIRCYTDTLRFIRAWRSEKGPDAEKSQPGPTDAETEMLDRSPEAPGNGARQAAERAALKKSIHTVIDKVRAARAIVYAGAEAFEHTIDGCCPAGDAISAGIDLNRQAVELLDVAFEMATNADGLVCLPGGPEVSETE